MHSISRHKTTEFALQAASKLRLAEAELAIQRELRIEERTLELALLSKFAAVGMVRIALDGTFLWGEFVLHAPAGSVLMPQFQSTKPGTTSSSIPETRT